MFLLLAAGAARAERPTLVFGIVPQQSAERLVEAWGPLLDYIGLQAGLRLVFATAKDIPTFESCLSQGAYDIAYMNPYHYTVFHQAPGYVAFARQARKQLKGLVVVRKDSSIKTLRDLDGMAVAFPSPAAFGASVVPRAEMRAAGIRIDPHYVLSHDSVYRAVAGGLVPAGGGVARTFGSIDPKVRDKLRVIYETKGYTPHAFAAHPRVSQSAVLAIAAAMKDVATTAPALLKRLHMTGFRSAKDQDWDNIRALRLTQAQPEIRTRTEALCRAD